MKALLLDGMNEGGSAVEQAVLADLEAGGYEIQHLVLRDMKIAPCTGCFGCWTKTPGECVQHDDANAVPRAIANSDLMVLLTPVTFGGYSFELKKALDRSISILLPFFGRYNGEIHHLPRYERYPALVAVGVMDKPDERAERIFHRLVERNGINMHVPSHKSTIVSNEDSAGIRTDVA